jgi:hypothetical protein
LRYERAMQAAGEELREDPFFPWLSAHVVLLSTIQVGVVGAALASLRLSRPLAASLLAVSALVAGLVWRGLREGKAPPWAGISEHRWGWRLAGAFAALYLLLLACAVIAPDISWDGNSYHLPAIQQWYQHGQVIWVEGPESTNLGNINGHPKAAEVVSFFLSCLIHPALSKAHNLVYLPLGILGVASLALALGASRGAALLAGAVLLLVPINLGQSPTAYVDSAFGSAAIAWLAVTVRLRRLDAERYGWQALVLGCALGLMIGVKGTGLLLGAIGSLALCFVHLAGRPRTFSAPAVIAWWLGIGVGALAVGGFWYARSFAHGHSPLYPFALSIAGVTLFPGFDPFEPPGTFAVNGEIAALPAPLQIAFTWLQGLWRWPRSIVGFDVRLGGLGFLWALGCLPAIVALVRERARTRTTWREELVRQPLWLLLAIVGLGFLFQPCRWWSRYTIWIYGLGLPCLATLSYAAMGRRGRAWAIACASVALLEAGIVVARWQNPLLAFAVREQRGEPPVAPRPRLTTHFYPPWGVRGSVIEQVAHTADGIGIGPLAWYAEPLVGVFGQPLGARRIDFVPADLEADFDDWYARVRPRWVVMDKRPDVPEPMARLQPQVHQTRSLTVLQFW